MRMQIRKLISQSEKNRRHRGDLDQSIGAGGASTVGTGGNSKNKIDKRKNRVGNNNNNNGGNNHAKLMTHTGEGDEIVANSIVIANKMADLGELKGDEGTRQQQQHSKMEDIEMQNRASVEVKSKGRSRCWRCF